MNIKGFLVLAAVIAVVCGVCMYTNQGQEVNAQTNEYFAQKYEVKTIEVVNEEIKYSEEYDVEVNEITVKNTSDRDLKRVEFSKDYELFEIYNIAAGEEYTVISFNIENNDSIEVISTDYKEAEEDLSLEIQNDNSKVKGTVTNNSQEKIYPNRIVIFLEDAEGTITQRSLEYAGCFFEDLVIRPEAEFDFEFEIPEGYTVVEDKGLVFKYSDLEFKSYDIKMFEEM